MAELCKRDRGESEKSFVREHKKGPGKYVCATLFGACAPGGKSEVSMEDP